MQLVLSMCMGFFSIYIQSYKQRKEYSITYRYFYLESDVILWKGEKKNQIIDVEE
jgi:hypothetical protein